MLRGLFDRLETCDCANAHRPEANRVGVPEVDAVSRADIVGTGRDEAAVHAVTAEIAFLGDPFGGVEGDGLIGAGPEASLASGAGGFVQNDDAVGALYFRLPRLLQDLALSKGDGRYTSLLKSIARADLIVLDDWGLKGFSVDQQHDLLEVLEDRHGLRSTLITSQLATDHWHELITNATVADAICDRLVHNAHRITLKGESMRKTKNRLT
jgi:hypothetical protein